MRNTAKRKWGGMEIELLDLPDLGRLELEWRDLEARSDISFFISWTWIGAWLHSLPEDIRPRLLRANLNGRVMALGVFVPTVLRKARCIPVNVWLLNETGRPELDNITIEYNGLVIDDTVKHVLEPLLLEHMMAQRGEWDELQFNALRRPLTAASRLLKKSGCAAKQRVHKLRKPAYQVCLKDTRDAGQHIRLIKQKPRYHIKRSLAAYETTGPVTVEIAQSVDQALAFLSRLKHFHGQHWADKSENGAFDHPFCNTFHDRLVRSAFNRGEIQLMAIKAGSAEIAYLYNFVWQGHVYNYQSGVNYPQMGGKYSPGMTAHSLAIDYNAAQGHHTYDLMAGDHQYKRALTLQAVQLDWWFARHTNLATHAEDGLRKAARVARYLSALTQHTESLKRAKT